MHEISLKGQHVILRKPNAKITEENYKILQFLDLLKNIDISADQIGNELVERLANYLKNEKITEADIDRYISFYPDKVYRNFYEMRLYCVFAELFREMIYSAATDLNLPIPVVEKDYYVTMLLKQLAEKAPTCVFKRGTNLIKCDRIISNN